MESSKPWLTRVPPGFWNNPENVRQYCDWLFHDVLGFITQEQKYRVERTHFKLNHGGGLLDTVSNRSRKRSNGFEGHGKGIIDILRTAYPSMKWYPWKFNVTSQGCWNDFENHKLFVKYVEDEENITTPDEWYKYTHHVISKHGGEGLLVNRYGSSLLALLRLVYPDFEWKPYKFERVGPNYWADIENVRSYLKDFAVYTGIVDTEDWYRVSSEDFQNFHGGGLIDFKGRFGSYIQVIVSTIDYPWNLERFRCKGSTSKRAIRYFEWLQKTKGRRLVFRGNSIKERDYEFRIPDTRWHVDCYDLDSGEIIEFFGDWWHGKPGKHDDDYIHPVIGIPWKEVYERSLQRINTIRTKGFNVSYVWESDTL